MENLKSLSYLLNSNFGFGIRATNDAIFHSVSLLSVLIVDKPSVRFLTLQTCLK